MTKREAMRIAHRIAYQRLQQALDVGGSEVEEYENAAPEEQVKIDDALDRLTQRHFELGDTKRR